MKPHTNSRKLLQDDGADIWRPLSPPVTYSPDPLLQPMNGTSSTLTKRPLKLNSAFDTSMSLTALVLITALFFMGIFSIYLCRFADVFRRCRRRRNPRPPYSTSSLPHPPWRSSLPKGLESPAVRSLPFVSYCGDAKHPIDCVICLSEFEEVETVKQIAYCRHVFHAECLDTWLSSNVSCPLCRSTRMFVIEEVRLDVSQGENDRGGGEDGLRSTEDSGDTSIEEGTN